MLRVVGPRTAGDDIRSTAAETVWAMDFDPKTSVHLGENVAKWPVQRFYWWIGNIESVMGWISPVLYLPGPQNH